MTPLILADITVKMDHSSTNKDLNNQSLVLPSVHIEAQL